MEVHSFIHHFSMYFADSFEGFVVKETEHYFEYIHPIAYVWMNKISIENWMDIIETKKVDKRYVSAEKIPFTKDYESWIFSYPITAQSLSHFFDISLFFETLTKYSNKKIVQRLEMTISTLENKMPFYQLESLVKFVFEQHKQDKDRLRFLFSEKIKNYLYPTN